MLFSKFKKKLKDILNPLSSDQKKKYISLFFLNLILSFIELLSLSSIIPLISIIFEKDLPNNKFISYFNLENYEKNEILFYLSLLILLIFTLRFFCIYFIKYLNFKFIFNLQYSLTNKLYSKFLFSSYLSHISNNNSTILRTSLEETRHYTVGLLLNLSNFFIELTFLILIIFTLLLIYPLPTIFLLFFGFIVILIYTHVTRKKLIDLGFKRIKHDNAIYKHASDTFENLRDIKIYNKENKYFFNFNNINFNLFKIHLKQQSIQVIPSLLFEFLGILLLVTILIIFIYLNYDLEIMVMNISIATLIMIKLLPSISKIVVYMQNLAISIASAARMNQYLNINTISKNEYNIKKSINNISLNNFSINYDNKIILMNSNIKFKRSNITGLVGSSGSGKTSIINLILGLIPLTKGKFKLNSKNSTLDKIQNKIAVVSKDNYLANDSIRANIIFGSAYNKKKFQNTLKMSLLEDLVKDLPKKDLTLIGSSGLKFSDGQKQRISIARALYNKKPILILDEATNTLDSKLRKILFENLSKINRDKIIIIISHDIKLIKKYCYNIFEIKKKKIHQIK